MAPPRTAGEPVTYSAEYNEFIAKLRAYHERRGTHFDPEPRVGAKHVDLLALYNMVVGRGGYDVVSDEKLAWRKLGQDFNVGSNNLPALAFQLKTVYYKYLSAYEISTIHGKEPPPREILEDTTAKGGGLLTRTMENFKPSNRRGENTLGNENSEASGDDGTPVRDRNGSEEIPGSGGRVTRGLRHAPPQRILFQPETQSSRPRHSTSHTSQPPPSQQQSHQPQGPRGASTSYNPSSSTENMSQAVANYEPRPQMPLTLRPVITPGNNAVEFARRQKAMDQVAANGKVNGITPAKVMLPGSGFDGPNIYVRCLCALKSGIPAEQNYALHHLVKISMERGEKYRFESFPGLVEALIEKLLEVSSLFYDIDWQLSYTEDGELQSADTIDGLNGTADILGKISRLSKLPVDDNIQTAEFSDALLQINEAALTLRNMMMLEGNAEYVSELYPLRDFISIALNLPNLDCVVELKHYALDIAEQLTKYIPFNESDHLYISLLAQLQTQDRGAILTTLRAISRISMNLEENNLLKGVPLAAVQNIIDWTLLYDEDLVHVCLDFLYQYTAVVDNVEFLLTHIQVDPFVNQLTRLLTHNVRIVDKEMITGYETRLEAPTELVSCPQELFAQLLKMDEPERSSQWLRCIFEEDRDEYITQIALWQAYQARFTNAANETGRPLLPAAEFIKNVSTTFADKATAQVQTGATQKFIIKGIRMRSVPVDLKGDEYTKCLWRRDHRTGKPCTEFFMSPEAMYQHILQDHLGATQQPDGKFDNTHGEFVCQWDKCRRFRHAPEKSMRRMADHIKIHLPPAPITAPLKDPDYFGPPPTKRWKPSYIIPSPRKSFTYQNTAVDENNQAAGIPLSAVLVLRNLARNIPKTETEENTLKEGGVSWVDRLFRPVEPKLFDIMAHNRSLQFYTTDLLSSIKESC